MMNILRFMCPLAPGTHETRDKVPNSVVFAPQDAPSHQVKELATTDLAEATPYPEPMIRKGKKVLELAICVLAVGTRKHQVPDIFATDSSKTQSMVV